MNRKTFGRTNIFNFKPSIALMSRAVAGTRISLVVWLLIGAALCAATVIGCGWGGVERSVRFTPYMDEREFGRLPPLPVSALMKHRRDSDGEMRGESDEKSSAKKIKEINALWDAAQESLKEKDAAQMRQRLSEYMERSEAFAPDASFYDGSESVELLHGFERRNSAADQLDALKTFNGETGAALWAYLEARRVYDSGLEGSNAVLSTNPEDNSNLDGPRRTIPTEAEKEEAQKNCFAEVRRLLDTLPRASRLEDGAQYLRAALLYREGQTDEAIRAFKSVAARDPRSAKHSAALYMAARLSMKQSASFGGEDASATETDLCVGCEDAAWHEARNGFQRLLRDDPRGRFADDARGWLAYLDLRVGDTANALIEYYRLLSDANDSQTQASVLTSLRLTRGRATDEDMARVENVLANEPAAALTYAYHNIYNYSFSYYLDVEVDEDANPYKRYKEDYGDENYDAYTHWQQTHEDAARSVREHAELARIAAFATRLMRRYPHAGAGGAFTLRVAQADLELDDNNHALEFAKRALVSGVRNNERAQALWVKGVAEYRLRDYAAARTTLNTLATQYPHGDLTEGAHRLIALVAEDAGDLSGALEQYLALDYDSDVAYFVDVLMTPEQLAAYIESHPQADNLDELLYALGVRYLRVGRYDEARATFVRVHTTRDSSDTAYLASQRYTASVEYDASLERKTDPKYQTFNDYDDETGKVIHRQHGIVAQWILRDMKTADDLQLLERRAETATGDEAKAEALYQLASYLYEGGDLTFYNPAAWKGWRTETLVNFDESHYRAPNEAQTLWSYMQQHESIAHALVIYLDVARRFPNTRAARDALYTAAICQEHLSNFNGYWRNIYEMNLHAGDRMVTYADVRRTYPRYQLPRATNGWEPSTRTVNGGPGWDAPPKPRPRLSKWARLKLKLALLRQKLAPLYHRALNFWEAYGRRWVMTGLLLACLPFALRRSKRARELLREQLARPDLKLKTETPPVYRGLLMSRRTLTLDEELRDELRARLRSALQQTMPLVFDATGLRTLVIVVATHGLLITVAVALLKMFYS